MITQMNTVAIHIIALNTVNKIMKATANSTMIVRNLLFDFIDGFLHFNIL